MKRVALAIIVNKQGQYLLQHKDKEAPNNPDTWCLFGGAVEEGEAPEEAIVREVREELLETVTVTDHYLHTIDQENQIQRFFYVIRCNLPEQVLKSQLQEGDDVAYFSFGQAKELKINAAHLEIIKKHHKDFLLD